MMNREDIASYLSYKFARFKRYMKKPETAVCVLISMSALAMFLFAISTFSLSGNYFASIPIIPHAYYFFLEVLVALCVLGYLLGILYFLLFW